MNVAAYPLQQAVPSWRDGLLAQIRILFARYWPALTFFFLAMFLYALAPAFGDAELARNLFDSGMIGFPGQIAFGLITLFWAISVWSDFPVRERTFLRVLPISRLDQALHRSLAGLILLLSTLLGALLLGSVLALNFSPDLNYFQGTRFYVGGLVLMVLRLSNAYMAGNLLAFWVKRPEYWALIWIPFGIAGVAALLNLLGLSVLVEGLGVAGEVILTGIGFIGQEMPISGVETTATLLLYFVLLGLFNVASMMEHREVIG